MRRFRAQLVLLFAALLMAHAQCLLACAVDECRQASLPPCHRHHNVRICGQDQFVAAPQAPLANQAPPAVAALPATAAAIVPASSASAPVPPLSPPLPVDVSLLTPLRI
jgi:hypothetical protein